MQATQNTVWGELTDEWTKLKSPAGIQQLIQQLSVSSHGFFGRIICYVNPKIIYFYYLKCYFVDQGIHENIYLILLKKRCRSVDRV